MARVMPSQVVQTVDDMFPHAAKNGPDAKLSATIVAEYMNQQVSPAPRLRVLASYYAGTVFRFLRHPRSPITPRPPAKSGKAAGNGVGVTGVVQVPGLLVTDPKAIKPPASAISPISCALGEFVFVWTTQLFANRHVFENNTIFQPEISPKALVDTENEEPLEVPCITVWTPSENKNVFGVTGLEDRLSARGEVKVIEPATESPVVYGPVADVNKLPV